MPTGIRERYLEAIADPELLRIHQDMALLDAIITGHTQKVKDGKMPTLVQEKRLLALMEQRRRLSDSETRRQSALQQNVSMGQFMAVMRVVAELIRDVVTDPDQRKLAQQRLAKLLLARDTVVDGEVLQKGGDDGDGRAGANNHVTAGGGQAGGTGGGSQGGPGAGVPGPGETARPTEPPDRI